MMRRHSQNLEVAPYILALREKLADKNYIDSAIQRIAQVLSAQIIESGRRM